MGTYEREGCSVSVENSRNARGGSTKMPIQFWICRCEQNPRRWVVRRNEEIYGEYLDREQAKLDAMEAATDARQVGHAAEVWDRPTAARVL